MARDSQDFERTIEDLQGALRVAHIAESPIKVADVGESVSTVRSWSGPGTINNVPVTRSGVIVGVLENINGDVDGYATLPDNGKAGQALRNLSADMLVEGALPLDGFLQELLVPPHYRLVLRGGKIDAIVTPSDLNKLAVRLLAYCAVAHLEETMLRVIRARVGDDEAAVALLGPDGARQVSRSYADLKGNLINPSMLGVTSLKQKGTILARAGVFLGGAREVEADFAAIYEGLRNPLAHAGDYLTDSLEGLRRFTTDLERVRVFTQQASAAS